MMITVCTAATCRRQMRTGKPALDQELELWARAEEGRLAKGESAPEAKSEDMKCYEELGRMAGLYCISDLTPEDLNRVVIHFMTGLSAKLPALGMIILESSNERLRADRKTLQALQGLCDYHYHMRMGPNLGTCILVGIYEMKVQELLDPTALYKIVDKKRENSYVA